MTAKRRNKLRKLAWEIPKPKTIGPNEGQILLVGWGSALGPITEAVARARGMGEAVSGLHIRHVNPLPNGLEDIFPRLPSRLRGGVERRGAFTATASSPRCCARATAIPKSAASTNPTASPGRSVKSSNAPANLPAAPGDNPETDTPAPLIP
ncbi:MAG: hypothetical protein HC841_08910 [Verrucomicrobiae bacterium]|nr:hypothetical protein [Verrucomicrobiae bacterium]